MSVEVAVLITCHNRKEKTLRCIDQLLADVPASVVLQIYVVDDGCTDGTASALRTTHPKVSIIPGDGTLFWCNGMRKAWQHATKHDPDFYLWLNDDTFLRCGGLEGMLKALVVSDAAGSHSCIIVGSCCDPVTGDHTYGGLTGWDRHPARLRPVVPDPTHPRHCETFNGNCVLVPRETFRRLGPMRRFKHAIGDIDYGLRATRAGIGIIVAPGHVAECTPGDVMWRCLDLPRIERWRLILGRKGLPPLDWWRFLWAHAGIRALLYWPIPYCRVLLGC